MGLILGGRGAEDGEAEEDLFKMVGGAWGDRVAGSTKRSRGNRLGVRFC